MDLSVKIFAAGPVILLAATPRVVVAFSFLSEATSASVAEVLPVISDIEVRPLVDLDERYVSIIQIFSTKNPEAKEVELEVGTVKWAV